MARPWGEESCVIFSKLFAISGGRSGTGNPPEFSVKATLLEESGDSGDADGDSDCGGDDDIK